jgi:hypothetical protein
MTVSPLDPAVRVRTALRIVPAPTHTPPFDDDGQQHPRPHLTLIPGQAELPLEWLLPSGLPARPDLPLVVLRGGGEGPAAQPAEDDFGPLPTPRSQLPAPGPWAGRLVQAFVEVMSGDRPIGQLIRWTHEDVYAQLRTLTTRRPAKRVRAQVRSVHVTEPLDGVAEVCAVVHDGARARAYALRLVGTDGRWCCTDLIVV